MKKTVICALAVFAASLASAAGRGEDSTGEYWEDDAGVKHYYLFTLAKTGTFWSLNNNTYSREVAQAGSGATVNWRAGSIFTFEKDTSYSLSFNCDPTPVMYGMEFETLNRANAPHAITFESSTAKYTIGEYGIHSVSGNTLQFQRKSDGPAIHLSASQTWSGDDAAVLSSAPFVIVPNYAYNATCLGYVTAEDDVTLTIEGDTVVPWIVYGHALTNMDVVVKAPAIISLPKGGWGTGNLWARKLTIDGGLGVKFGKDLSFIPATGSDSNVNGGAKAYGIGSVPLLDPRHVAQTVVLTNGATLTALETTIVSGGVTIVSAGTAANRFSGTFSLTDDSTVVRIEDGATLDLTSATFSGSGRYTLEGGGTVKMDAAQAQYARFSRFAGGIDMAASRLVVTDENVVGDVSVASGETLLVFGDGLGADAALTLAGGSILKFCRTSTIAAPVTSTGGVGLQTSDISVTGTVAGVWTGAATAASELKIDSPGLFVLAGGGTLGDKTGGYDTLRMNSGNAAVTGVVALYGYLRMYGGHLTIRDGGKVTISRNYRQIRMDQNTADTCLELGDGGEIVTLANTSENSVYIGKGSGSYESRVLLTGGNVTFNNRHYIALQAGGVIEIESGTFRTQRRISCTASATTENAKVVLRGGTFLAIGSDNYLPHIFNGAGACTVSVEGDATLRFEGPANMLDSDTGNCSWACTEGARLRLDGWRTDRNCAFTMHNFAADGLVFDLNRIAAANVRTVEVQIVDPADPVGIGFVLPGKAGSRVTAVADAAPALAASYIVPSGQTLDLAALPSEWHSGFGDVTVSNIVFDAASALRFPFFGDASPLRTSGSLTLPGTMAYTVAARGARALVLPRPVIEAAGGVTAPEDPAWTCAGGVAARNASLTAGAGALLFAYSPASTVILLR